jgi:hypothetical protein
MCSPCSFFCRNSPFAIAEAYAGYEDALCVGILGGVFDANQTSLLDITQEFGTVPAVLVARSVILENAAYHLARGSEQHVVARSMLKQAFYVPTRDWKTQVLQRGLAALDETLAHLHSSTRGSSAPSG